MKTPSLPEIKKELFHLSAPQIGELCMRLAKYKKENKELLHYLLFDAAQEDNYIRQVKIEIDQQFREISGINWHNAYKSIRKILKFTSKCIKFSGNKVTEVELLVHFCSCLIKAPGKLRSGTVFNNLYHKQIEKLEKNIAKLHEDLQFDYQIELEKLRGM